MKNKSIILLAIETSLFISCDDSKSNSTTNENWQPQTNNVSHSKSSDAPDNIGAYVISQNFVKDNIVSPSTADFPIEPTNVKCIGNKFMVLSYLDAQNSYGAKIREKYMCYQIYNGGEWSNKSNWTLMALAMGDELTYINKNKTEQEIANDIDYLRTH